MASVSEFFGGSYLTAADVKRAVTLTVANVDFEVIQNTQKIVIEFENTELRYVLNKSNAKTIAAKYGDDTDGWTGCRLTLSPGLTEYNGVPTPCILVSIPDDKPAKPKIPPKPPVEDPFAE